MIIKEGGEGGYEGGGGGPCPQGRETQKGKVKSVTKLINFIYIYIIKINKQINREILKEGGS